MKKTYRRDTPAESATDFNLLIRVDSTLLNCVFLYMQKGPLPVLYPLESFIRSRSRPYGHEFDGSLGAVAFGIKNDAVKVSFDPDAIAATVREFLEKLKDENR